MNSKSAGNFIFIALILLSNTAFSDQQDDYDQCILQNLPNVKHDWVSQQIKRICKENYLNIAGPSKNKQRYNQCIMQYLPEVESQHAAGEIIKTCRRMYLD